MHPEIEKFWTDLDYILVDDTIEFEIGCWKTYWTIIDMDGYYKGGRYEIGYAGVSHPYPTGIKNVKCGIYFFNEKEYIEREMLKIVRLKAFI